MKKIIFALVAIAPLAISGLATAENSSQEITTRDQDNPIVATQSVHVCWLEQMEKMFIEFEPDPQGNAVLATEILDLSKCPPTQS
ncbi:MAG: hypothetical protein HOB82_07360 [Alphaproteobacteria bacterium]|nr:hypothetical protein [Alphaproteobacteria bacterium]